MTFLENYVHEFVFSAFRWKLIGNLRPIVAKRP